MRESRKNHNDDVVTPAVKYVKRQRERNNEDEKDKKLMEKLESEALKNSDKPFRNYTSFMHMSTLSRKLASQTWADDMARRLIEWVEGPGEPLVMGDFYRMVGIYNEEFYRMSLEFEILSKALEYARMVIGCRRENGMLARKLDPGSTAYMMPHYSTEWKKIAEWRASLRQPAGDSGQPRIQYVVIPEVKIEQGNLLENKDVCIGDKNASSGQTTQTSKRE